MNSSNILIVGAGPVGLAAAVELTRLGAKVRIIDQRSTRTTESRALAVNPRTLELLEAAEVTPRLIAAGVKVKALTMFTRGRAVARIDVSRIRHRYNALAAPERN